LKTTANRIPSVMGTVTIRQCFTGHKSLLGAVGLVLSEAFDFEALAG